MIEELNKTQYVKLDKDPTEQIEKGISKLLLELTKNNMIEKNNYIKQTKLRIPQIYGTIKIHKSNYPIRPIVDTKFSPLSNIEKYLLIKLNETFHDFPHVVKNSYDLKKLLTEITINNNSEILSLDVVSMYTNINIDKLKDIIRDKYAEEIVYNNYPKDIAFGIVDLLAFTLDNNYFQYKSNYYRQIDGLAMGSPLAPILANIYMDHIESTNIIPNVDHILYKRYMDDILIITKDKFTNDIEEDLLNNINNIDDNLKFKLEKGNKNINFLDISIKLNNSTISTNLYKKEINTRQTLNYHSNHPLYIKKNIIQQNVFRINNLTMDNADKTSNINNLKKELMLNDYPIQWINKTLKEQPKTADNLQNNKIIFTNACGYIPKLFESLKHICYKYNIRLAPKPINTIKKYFPPIKSKCYKDYNQHNVIYKIPCSCNQAYVGETKRPLKVRIKEHERAVRLAQNKTGLDRHTSKTSHTPQWDNITILNSDNNLYLRLLKESENIKKLDKLALNDMLGIQLPTIWQQKVGKKSI